ncbi:TPM domain-containing protein [Hydrogenophaga sp. 5NK40-0174]|uniref:TPM domain-containing protein n=1 Tax=Hydrogenophaga sp. 5NK40-0174 TaxID=3127649 RepID=UPI0033421B53
MRLPTQHLLAGISLLVLAWLCLALPLGAHAANRLPLPAITAHVTDQTSTLSPSQIAQLEAKLSEFESRRGTQIIVVIVPTTQPEDVFSYTQRLARATAVGRAEVGDGLVLVVAKNDRRMHIATSRALEGAIPDMIAKRIIDQVLTPAFRRGDFAGGISAALDHLFARVEGEALPLPAESASSSSSSSASSELDGDTLENLLLFVFLGYPVIQAVFRGIFGRVFGVLASGVFAGGLAWFVSGALYVGVAFFVIGIIVAIFFQVFGLFSAASKGSGSRGGRWGGGSGGGWSSGGGGGGWSSGGGGSFGGGGASGGW